MGLQVGLRRVVDTLTHGRVGGLAAIVIRTWGFCVAGGVFLLGEATGKLGSTRDLAIWSAGYASYCGVLELKRKGFGARYDSSAFRLGRVLANVTAATALVAIAPESRAMLWIAYLIPISAAFVYFTDNLRPSGTVVLSLIGLYLGGVVLGYAPAFDVWHFAAATICLIFFSACLWGSLQLIERPNPLSEIADKFHHTLHLDELSRQIVDRAIAIAGADRALLIILEHDSGFGEASLPPRYIHHATKNFTFRPDRPIERFCGKCQVVHGEPFASGDLKAEFPNGSIYEKYFTCQPRSLIAEPLRTKSGAMLGVLSLTHDQPNRFDRFTRRIVRDLTSQVAPAVENALSFRLSALREARNQDVSAEFQVADSEHQVVELGIEAALKIPHVTGAALFRTDTVRHTVTISKRAGSMTADDANTLQHLAIRCAARRQPQMAHDATVHEWFNAGATETVRSVVVTPIWDAQTRSTGAVLAIASPTPSSLSSESEHALANIAHQMSGAFQHVHDMERERLLDKLHAAMRLCRDRASEEDVYKWAVDTALQLLPFQSVAVGIFDESNREYEMRLWETSNLGAPHGYLRPFNAHADVERALANAQQLQESYVLDSAAGRQIITPLVTAVERRIGLLICHVEADKTVAPHEFKALSLLASATASSIESARHLRQVENQRARTEAFINALSGELGKCRDEQTVGDVTAQIGARVLNAEAFTIYIVRDGVLTLTNSTYLAGTEYIGRMKPVLSTPGAGFPAWAAATGRTFSFANREQRAHPAFAGDINHERYLTSHRCTSLLIRPIPNASGDIIAVFAALNKTTTKGAVAFTTEDEKRMDTLGQQFALSLASIDWYRRADKSERRGVEDDLHELANFHRFAVVVAVENVKAYLEAGNIDAAMSIMPDLATKAHSVQREMRSLLTTVASAYAETDFRKALHSVTDLWKDRISDAQQIPVHIDCPEVFEVPPFVKYVMLRIASAAVANAIQHSGAIEDTAVRIELQASRELGRARLRIRDSGKGINGHKQGYGITRMQQLIKLIEYHLRVTPSLEIQSSSGSGTTVLIEVPC